MSALGRKQKFPFRAERAKSRSSIGSPFPTIQGREAGRADERCRSMSRPEWMPKAVGVARKFRATSIGQAGANHSVYVILLHNSKRPLPWGLYVGQTSRPRLEVRSAQVWVQGERCSEAIWRTPVA